MTNRGMGPGGFSLSADELAAYRRDGYLIRESVFKPHELAELRDAAERATATAARWIGLTDEDTATYDAARPELPVTPYTLNDGDVDRRFIDVGYLTVQYELDATTNAVRVIEPVHELDTTFDMLIDDRRLADPMRQLVRSDTLSLWTAKLNLKRPVKLEDGFKGGSEFRWHQDSPYWGIDCEHSVDNLPNVMVLFDDAEEANGCLRVVRASHTRGCLPPLQTGSVLNWAFTDPAQFKEEDQVAMVAPAGSVVFFDPHSVHGSQPNRSSLDRRALIVTYQPGGFKALKSKQIRQIPAQPQPNVLESTANSRL